MANLFTYGTLEIPQVMEAVTGYTFRSMEAVALGFARFLLKDRMYPGMISHSSETTSGRLYVNIDLNTLKVLDDFEDEVYTRELINVQTLEGQNRQAYAYIIPTRHREILSSARWRRDQFMDAHLPTYLEGYRTFCQQSHGYM